jgi:hypothetical protein
LKKFARNAERPLKLINRCRNIVVINAEKRTETEYNMIEKGFLATAKV